MKQLTAILIGAGSRGRRYTDIMANSLDKFKAIGVAEPIVELLYDYLCGNIVSENLSEIGISCKKSRLNDTVIDMDKYFKKVFRISKKLPL